VSISVLSFKDPVYVVQLAQTQHTTTDLQLVACLSSALLQGMLYIQFSSARYITCTRYTLW